MIYIVLKDVTFFFLTTRTFERFVPFVCCKDQLDLQIESSSSKRVRDSGFRRSISWIGHSGLK